MQFNGENNYMVVPYNAALNVSTGITISLWLKADYWTPSDMADIVLDRRNTDNNRTIYGLYQQNGNLELLLQSGFGAGINQKVSVAAPPTNQWIHIVATWSGSALRMYANGGLAATNSTTTSGSISTNYPRPMLLARPEQFPQAGAAGFKGALDEVRIYNRALSAADVQELYVSSGALSAGLVAYYPFEGNANDATGNGWSGNPLGSPAIVNGRFGQAYYFDGVNDRISLPGSLLNSGLPKGTLSCWISVESFLAQYGRSIFNRGIAANSTSLALGVGGSGKLGASIADTTLPSATSVLPLNQFIQVALTWDGARVKYFVNGALDGDITSAVSVPSGSSRTVDIGVDDQDVGWFKGGIDEVRIYNRALAASEIWQLYVASLTGLAVSGPATVGGGDSCLLGAHATYSSGNSRDVSSAATFALVGSVPPGTSIQGNRLFAGNVTSSTEVEIEARYSEGGVTVKSPTFSITVQPRLTVTITATREPLPPLPFGRHVLSAQVLNASGPVTYEWYFTAEYSHGATDAGQTFVAYIARGTYPVTLTVSDSQQSVTTWKLISVNAPLAFNQPTTTPAPDPHFGTLRDSASPTDGVSYDAAWFARTNNGLIVVCHGMQNAATNEWVVRMASTIRQKLQTNGTAGPNVVLFDWKDAADPQGWMDLLEDSFPELFSATGVDWAADSIEKVIWIPDFAKDAVPIREWIAPVQGMVLANWIRTNITSGRISSNAPVHLIGHSAGGFVSGEAALSLGNTLGHPQVTMLDTPFPYRRHVDRYQQFGKVERYISSVFGMLTEDFQTPGSVLIDSDINLACTLFGMLCGKASIGCSWLCNQLPPFSVPTDSEYHRSVLIKLEGSENVSDVIANYARLVDHSLAHEWYTASVTNGTNNGFYYSPWQGNAFPSSGEGLAAMGFGPMNGPEILEEHCLTNFSTFGAVTQTNGVHTASEELDAGIFTTLALPVGADILRFSYQFVGAGDGDFLSVNWGSNVVLFTGPDLELTRAAFYAAEVPIDILAGQTNTLVFTLVSRGQTNASVSLKDICYTVIPDVDGDGLLNDLEASIGTDPRRSDTDGDGLDDGYEVNVLTTDPLLVDTDGDGSPDGAEVAAGTDPKLTGSVLVVSSIQLNPDLTVTLGWVGASNRTYRVHQAGELPAMVVTTLTNGLPAVLPTTSFTTTPATNSARFYWIEVE